MRDKRSALAPVALRAYEGGGSSAPRIGASPFKLKDGSGLYSTDALAEFLQYEFDGSFQTDINEYWVRPFCLVSVCLDGITALKEKDPGKARSVLLAVSAAFTKVTRKSDRAARFVADLGALLRRTDPKSVRQFYVPRVKEPLAAAARDAGLPTTLSFGIAGHPDAAVRGVEDIFLKTVFAVEEAKKRGPGSVVIYDPKTMPATIDGETAKALGRRLR